MPNPEVDLSRPGALRFQHRYIREAEMIALKETGQGIAALMQGAATFYVVPLLLWTGLRPDDRTVTREKADAILERHAGGYEDVAKIVIEAFAGSGLFTSGNPAGTGATPAS